MALSSSKCSLSILRVSQLRTATNGLQRVGLTASSSVIKASEEPRRPDVFTLFSFRRAQRALSSGGATTDQLQVAGPLLRRWCKAGARGGGLNGHRGKLLCAGCWPSPQTGIYVQLRGRLFRADAQVCEQFVIGRFMANKHIVWYTVINYINNFKIVCTSYSQHLVLLIICLPDSN